MERAGEAGGPESRVLCCPRGYGGADASELALQAGDLGGGVASECCAACGAPSRASPDSVAAVAAVAAVAGPCVLLDVAAGGRGQGAGASAGAGGFVPSGPASPPSPPASAASSCSTPATAPPSVPGPARPAALPYHARPLLMAAVVAYVVVLAALASALLLCVDTAARELYAARLAAQGAVGNYAGALAVWIVCAVAAASASYAWTQLLSPQAVGTGLPQIRSIIVGGRVPGALLAPRTLAAKVVGVALSAGSGLFVWTQGASYHIAACVADLLLRAPLFRELAVTPGLRQQLMSAAVACAMCAQFGAPVGGVLYSIESAASYVPSGHYWVCTMSAVVSALVARAIFNARRGATVLLQSFYAGMVQSEALELRGRAWEMTLLGSALLVGLASALLAIAFLRLSQAAFRAKLRLTGKWSLTSASATLPVPLGVYEPCLLIGVAFGRLVGEILCRVGSPVPAALCGLLGAGAFAGSTHHTFSAALITLELAGTMDVFLPVLVATTLSILICRYARAKFIVQQSSEYAGVPLVWENFHLAAQSSVVHEVMERSVPLPCVATLAQIEEQRRRALPVIPVVFSLYEPYLLGEIAVDALPTSGMGGEVLQERVRLAYSPAPCIAELMALHEVHTLFSTMGLTHAFVVRSGRLVGIVTWATLTSAIAKHDRIL
eukprot:m51a1_g10757 hypothetical protein (667) ;mRNA; f:279-2790